MSKDHTHNIRPDGSSLEGEMSAHVASDGRIVQTGHSKVQIRNKATGETFERHWVDAREILTLHADEYEAVADAPPHLPGLKQAKEGK